VFFYSPVKQLIFLTRDSWQSSASGVSFSLHQFSVAPSLTVRFFSILLLPMSSRRTRQGVREPNGKDVVHYLLHTTPGMHVCRTLGDVAEENEHHLPSAPRPFRNVAGVVLNRRGDAVAGVVMHDGQCFSVTERWSVPHSYHHNTARTINGRGNDNNDDDETEDGEQDTPALALHAPMVGGRLAVVTPASAEDAQHLQRRIAQAPPMPRDQQQQLLAEIRAARTRDPQAQAPTRAQAPAPAPPQLSQEEAEARQDALRQQAIQVRIRMGQEYAAQQKAREEERQRRIEDNIAYNNARANDLMLRKKQEADAAERLAHPPPGTAPPTPEQVVARNAENRARAEAENRKLAAEASVRAETKRVQDEIAANSRSFAEQHMESMNKDRMMREKRQIVDTTYSQRIGAYQTALSAARNVPRADPTASHLPTYDSALYNQNLVYVAPNTFVSAIQKRPETPLAQSLIQRNTRSERPIPLIQFDADLVAHDDGDL
jgi:hypothetical protein